MRSDARTRRTARIRTASALVSLVVLLVGVVAWYGMRTLPAARYGPRRLASLPPDPGDYAGIDLARADLRTLNLRDKGELLLAEASFDSMTVWPMWPWKMPAGFNPKVILEEGKNPGLGLRTLHRKGITGEGIAIGIIDQDLLVDHIEYRDRVRLYDEVDARGQAEIHGAAVASIAAGRTVGAAPGADIYYFAIRMDPDRKCRNVSTAIDRILEINKGLPEGKKIRVVATSCSWRPGEPGYKEADSAARKAKAQGVFVISTVVDRYYDLAFQGLGRTPGRDPDDVSSYTRGAWWASEFEKWYPPGAKSTRLLVPMDSRTVSSHLAKDAYAFYRVGGWSWCVPYIAGVYALALQVHEDLTVDEFARAAVATGRYTTIMVDGEEVEFGPILNPPGLIEHLATLPSTESHLAR